MLLPDLGLGPGARAILARPGASRTHATFPPGKPPRLLIPRYPAAAAAASLRKYAVPGSRLSRIVTAGAAFVARVGGARIGPGAVSLGGNNTFLAHISEILNSEDLAFSVHLGPPRANRKPVVHVMTLAGESVAYVKLGVNEFTSRRVREEAVALQQLAHVSTPGLVVPTLIAAGEWEDLQYLVMEPLDNDALRVPSTPLREGALGALVRAFPVQEELLEQSPWWMAAVAELATLQQSIEKERLQQAAEVLSSRDTDHAIAFGAAHGDWSRWNMSASGGTLKVWDWERFSTQIPLGWDEIHFRLGAHPEGPRGALREGRTVPSIGGNQLAPQHAKTLLAAYLILRGISRLRAQNETGTASAALDTWLFPSIENLLRVGRSLS